MKEANKIEKEIFAVPDGYFEQLNKDILNATIKRDTNTPRRKHYILGKFSRMVGYAAAVAILFVATSNFFTQSNNSKNITGTDTTESEYIDNILNSYSIDDYTFYCYLTDSDY